VAELWRGAAVAGAWDGARGRADPGMARGDQAGEHGRLERRTTVLRNIRVASQPDSGKNE